MFGLGTGTADRTPRPINRTIAPKPQQADLSDPCANSRGFFALRHLRRRSLETPFCLDQRAQFLLRDFGRGNRVVGKRGETAVRRQQDAIRTKQLDGRFRARRISSTDSTRSSFWFTDPTPMADRGQIPQDVQLAARGVHSSRKKLPTCN